jgi:hypothetical protein
MKWEWKTCSICGLSKFYTDAETMAGIAIRDVFTPPDNRSVGFGGGFKGLGIKFDIYCCSRFKGHF